MRFFSVECFVERYRQGGFSHILPAELGHSLSSLASWFLVSPGVIHSCFFLSSSDYYPPQKFRLVDSNSLNS